MQRPETRVLTAEEMAVLKERALDCFQDDARSDDRYARQTVEFLAEKANLGQQWWLEFLSGDPDVWEELLGFSPFVDEEE